MNEKLYKKSGKFKSSQATEGKHDESDSDSSQDNADLDIKSMSKETSMQWQIQPRHINYQTFESMQQCKNFKRLFDVQEEPAIKKFQRVNAFDYYQSTESHQFKSDILLQAK